jgi:rhodanese-related sulfurtransferase
MSFETKNPPAVKEILGGDEGWVYLDVRSTVEFDQGHPEGAYNIPLAQMDAAGQMVPNDRFVEIVEKTFNKDSKLVLGCAAGGRSQRACGLLAAQGYASLINMMGGFSGARDMSGRVLEEGWQACGLPSSTQPEQGRSYTELS